MTSPTPRCVRNGCPSSSARRRRAPTSRSSSTPRASAARRWTTCCSSARPASARPRWRRSSRANSASDFRATSGPVIAKAGDLAALLTNLEPRDVLFIDEIHRLAPAVEEILYPAMEDFQLDLIIGEGPAARSVRIDLAVHAGRRHHARGPAHHAAARSLRHSGAARISTPRTNWTRSSLAAPHARHRHDADGAHEIARRARGTPRIAGRLLRRVRDFASVDGATRSTARSPTAR